MTNLEPAGSRVSLRPYQPADRNAFVALNLAWIEEYFTLEPSDRSQLEELESTILAPGGRIFVAQVGDSVVGTGAIIPHHDAPADGRKWLEIIKMTTQKKHRGKGIGRAILDTLISEARDMEADAIWLETNSTMTSAVSLYERCGFQCLSNEAFWPTAYARCSVQMVLQLYAK